MQRQEQSTSSPLTPVQFAAVGPQNELAHAQSTAPVGQGSDWHAQVVLILATLFTQSCDELHVSPSGPRT